VNYKTFVTVYIPLSISVWSGVKYFKVWYFYTQIQ